MELAAVVGDRGEVALSPPVADLLHADRDQPLKAALVEMVALDSLDDPPTESRAILSSPTIGSWLQKLLNSTRVDSP
jgi:hypothetical protein